MALFQFGSIVTGARNSVAGMTFSQNKGGGYIKAKPIPTNPRSAAQQLVRANFALNSKAWSGSLTDAQRAAWTLFAANNPYNNVFGQSKQLSGIAMYMKLSQVLAQIGEATSPDAPSDLSVPVLVTPTDVEFNWAAGLLTALTISTPVQAVVADAAFYIFATRPLPAGKQAGVSDYRYVTSIAQVAMDVALNIFATYTARFTAAAAGGTHISVIVATVNTATGATTIGLKFDTGPLM